MAKWRDKSRKFFELNIPTWILWVVIVSFVYVISLFIAYDVGKRVPQSKYGGFKAQETKREKGDPIKVPLFVPPEKVRHHPRFHFTFDNEKVLTPLRKREKLDQLIAGAKTDMEVFLRLMKWVRAQWLLGDQIPTHRLMRWPYWIRYGRERQEGFAPNTVL
jgi:hypothetical protein